MLIAASFQYLTSYRKFTRPSKFEAISAFMLGGKINCLPKTKPRATKKCFKRVTKSNHDPSELFFTSIARLVVLAKNFNTGLLVGPNLNVPESYPNYL